MLVCTQGSCMAHSPAPAGKLRLGNDSGWNPPTSSFGHMDTTSSEKVSASLPTVWQNYSTAPHSLGLSLYPNAELHNISTPWMFHPKRLRYGTQQDSPSICGEHLQKPWLRKGHRHSGEPRLHPFYNGKVMGQQEGCIWPSLRAQRSRGESDCKIWGLWPSFEKAHGLPQPHIRAPAGRGALM